MLESWAGVDDTGDWRLRLRDTGTRGRMRNSWRRGGEGFEVLVEIRGDVGSVAERRLG